MKSFHSLDRVKVLNIMFYLIISLMLVYLLGLGINIGMLGVTIASNTKLSEENKDSLQIISDYKDNTLTVEPLSGDLAMYVDVGDEVFKVFTLDNGLYNVVTPKESFETKEVPIITSSEYSEKDSKYKMSTIDGQSLEVNAYDLIYRVVLNENLQYDVYYGESETPVEFASIDKLGVSEQTDENKWHLVYDASYKVEDADELDIGYIYGGNVKYYDIYRNTIVSPVNSDYKINFLIENSFIFIAISFFICTGVYFVGSRLYTEHRTKVKTRIILTVWGIIFVLVLFILLI